MSTQKDIILSKVTGPDKLVNRGTFFQPPVTWRNDVTQLNETNLNKLSTGIKNVQDEFNQVSIGLEEILHNLISNNAGWKSVESSSGTLDEATGEIFNDYTGNSAAAPYTSARGLNTTAGKVYINNNGELITSGIAASAEGYGTAAVSDYQHVIGKWNIIDEDIDSPNNQYAFIVGNGNSESDRSNAFTIDWEGSGWFANGLTVEGKSCFKDSLRTHANLKVDNDVKLGTANKNTSLIVNSSSTFSKPVQLGNTLNVIGKTTLNDQLIVAGATILNDNLSVSKNVNVGINASVSGTLDVTGVATLKNNLNVIGDTDIDGKLDVNENAKVGGDLSVTGTATITDQLNVTKETNLKNTLQVTGATTLKNDLEVGRLETPSLQLLYRAPDGDNEEKETFTVNCDTILSGNLDVFGDSELSGKLKVTDVIDGHADIKSTTDLKIETGTYLVSVKDEHNHLDYANLDVNYAVNDTAEQKKAKKTVPNAIKKVKEDLIGASSITAENIGKLNVTGLTNTTIHGAAQYALDLVKNLLNAYILDEDNDDPEARSAIDKLIEISDWIKSDDAGAGKIISDIANEIANREAAVTQEKNRAVDIEQGLRTDLDKEVADRKEDVDAEETRATNAENTLTTNLNAEITRAKKAEADESDRAQVAEKVLTDNLAKEVADRTNDVNAEETRALAAEKVLTDKLSAEVTRATNKEDAINTALTNEVSRATGAETGLSSRIATMEAFFKEADIDASKDFIDTLKEIQSYIESDKTGAAAMTASIKANATAIEDEKSRAKSEEGTLQTNINTEATTARAAEKANSDAISALTTKHNNEIATKVDKVDGMGLSSNDYTDAEKTKLSGVEEGANKYEHPQYQQTYMGFYKFCNDQEGHIEDTTYVTKDDITNLGIPGQDTTYDVATDTADGLLSATDKVTYDGYAATIADLQNQIDALKVLVESHHSVVEEPEEPVDPETPIEPETPAEPENVEGEE